MGLRLDPGYVPAFRENEAYARALREYPGAAEPLLIALEREDGHVARGDIDVLPASAGRDADTLRLVERHLKFMLWSRGGWRLLLCGPAALCTRLQALFRPDGLRAFDSTLMQRIYGRPFEVAIVGRADIPGEHHARTAIGGHLEGCRLGFDLGASDYKLAAVKDGETVFSREIPWDPVRQTGIAYHFERIESGLREAAAHLPRLDAIGGSAAGIYVHNRVKVASLFRGIPDNRFATDVEPFFEHLSARFGVPFTVANDGDVTALAGAMALNARGILGIAMGSSEAVGYLNRDGHIVGWLNELAFAPVDFNPAAAPDEWSRDAGVGALYFSQQAVNRLALAGGWKFPEVMSLPERLKVVQACADKDDPLASEIFETIGRYLADALPHYARYYDFDHALLLGRVLSGRGGDRLLAATRQRLERHYPDLAARIHLQTPDERMRRVGQAVAAASLPEL